MSFALVALLLAAEPKWPLTAAELGGEAYLYNPRIDDSAPCKPKVKAPIELRLYARVKSGAQLRLTVKNCSGKPLKLLHDSALQPSKLSFGAKVKPPFDERSREKFDATVRASSFFTLTEGEERVLADETFTREGEEYGVHWGPFRYEAVPRGKHQVRVVLDAWVDSGYDEAVGKKVPIEGAAVGAFKSNEVTLSLP